MAKKEQKTEAQIAADKAEQEALISAIMNLTNSIPKKILNEASYQTAVTFKQIAGKARAAACAASPKLSSLRSHHSALITYYR